MCIFLSIKVDLSQNWTVYIFESAFSLRKLCYFQVGLRVLLFGMPSLNLFSGSLGCGKAVELIRDSLEQVVRINLQLIKLAGFSTIPFQVCKICLVYVGRNSRKSCSTSW